MDTNQLHSVPYKSRLNLNIKKKDQIKTNEAKLYQELHTNFNTQTTIMSQSSIQESVNSQHQKNVLNELKTTYSQLQKKYDEKRKQCDEVSNSLKKMEIMVLNSNPQYYQKQIKRLQTQLEKVQQENQNNKHKYFISENQRKQLQAAVKVKTQQVKILIKQLQKEKISVAELKHQITEKQRSFQRITQQVEKSNQNICESYDEVMEKHKKLQITYKNKITELEQLTKAHESLIKKNNDSQTQLKINKETYDKNYQNKNKEVDELKVKIRQMTNKNQEIISKLSEQVQELKRQKKTEGLLTEHKTQTAQIFKNNRVLEVQKNKLEEKCKLMSSQLQEKSKYIAKIQKQLKASCSKEQFDILEEQLKKVQKCHGIVIKQYQEKVIKLQKANQCLKLESFNINELQPKNSKDSFQNLLRNQIQESARLKKELSIKIDQFFNAKSEVQEQKLKVKMLQNEIDILKRKMKSEQKNHKIDNDVASQNLKNQVQSLKRKYEMTENKLNNKIKELKEKENFIMSTIVGRSKQQDVPLIMAQFKRVFQTDYINKLFQAQQKIKELATASQ